MSVGCKSYPDSPNAPSRQKFVVWPTPQSPLARLGQAIEIPAAYMSAETLVHTQEKGLVSRSDLHVLRNRVVVCTGAQLHCAQHLLPRSNVERCDVTATRVEQNWLERRVSGLGCCPPHRSGGRGPSLTSSLCWLFPTVVNVSEITKTVYMTENSLPFVSNIVNTSYAATGSLLLCVHNH